MADSSKDAERFEEILDTLERAKNRRAKAIEGRYLWELVQKDPANELYRDALPRLTGILSNELGLVTDKYFPWDLVLAVSRIVKHNPNMQETGAAVPLLIKAADLCDEQVKGPADVIMSSAQLLTGNIAAALNAMEPSILGPALKTVLQADGKEAFAAFWYLGNRRDYGPKSPLTDALRGGLTGSIRNEMILLFGSRAGKAGLGELIALLDKEKDAYTQRVIIAAVADIAKQDPSAYVQVVNELDAIKSKGFSVDERLDSLAKAPPMAQILEQMGSGDSDATSDVFSAFDAITRCPSCGPQAVAALPSIMGFMAMESGIGAEGAGILKNLAERHGSDPRFQKVVPALLAELERVYSEIAPLGKNPTDLEMMELGVKVRAPSLLIETVGYAADADATGLLPAALPFLVKLEEKYNYGKLGSAFGLETTKAVNKIVKANPNHPRVAAVALPFLIKALEYENEEIRQNAAEGLGLIAKESKVCPEEMDAAVPELARLINDELLNENNPAVINRALTALTEIAKARPDNPRLLEAVPAIIGLTSDPRRISAMLAGTALQAIAKHHPDSVELLPSLVEALKPGDRNAVRIAAAIGAVVDSHGSSDTRIISQFPALLSDVSKDPKQLGEILGKSIVCIISANPAAQAVVDAFPALLALTDVPGIESSAVSAMETISSANKNSPALLSSLPGLLRLQMKSAGNPALQETLVRTIESILQNNSALLGENAARGISRRMEASLEGRDTVQPALVAEVPAVVPAQLPSKTAQAPPRAPAPKPFALPIPALPGIEPSRKPSTRPAPQPERMATPEELRRNAELERFFKTSHAGAAPFTPAAAPAEAHPWDAAGKSYLQDNPLGQCAQEFLCIPLGPDVSVIPLLMDAVAGGMKPKNGETENELSQRMMRQTWAVCVVRGLLEDYPGASGNLSDEQILELARPLVETLLTSQDTPTIDATGQFLAALKKETQPRRAALWGRVASLIKEKNVAGAGTESRAMELITDLVAGSLDSIPDAQKGVDMPGELLGDARPKAPKGKPASRADDLGPKVRSGKRR